MDNDRAQSGRKRKSHSKRIKDYQEKLKQSLTPAGKYFSKELAKALDSECDSMNNDASDAIREFIVRKHLKSMESITAINKIAGETHSSPRITAYYMIMNYASLLLTSGRYNLYQGELDVTGNKLFEIWRIYAHRLVDLGEVTQAYVDKVDESLLEKVGTLGRPKSVSLFGMVRSLFSKK